MEPLCNMIKLINGIHGNMVSIGTKSRGYVHTIVVPPFFLPALLPPLLDLSHDFRDVQ